MNAREIADAILAGGADDDLPMISAALKEQWGVVARRVKNTFQVGDRVQFVQDGRRFAGQTGTVARKLPKNIDVELDDGRHVHAGATLLRRIDDDADPNFSRP